MSSWSCDLHSGHCAFGHTLHVFVHADQDSGLVLCAGPVPVHGIPSDPGVTTNLLTELTLHLESVTGGTTVWGAYSDFPEYSDHRLPIGNDSIGWIQA